MSNFYTSIAEVSEKRHEQLNRLGVVFNFDLEPEDQKLKVIKLILMWMSIDDVEEMLNIFEGQDK